MSRQFTRFGEKSPASLRSKDGFRQRVSSIRDTKENNYSLSEISVVLERRNLFSVFSRASCKARSPILTEIRALPRDGHPGQQDNDELSHVCAERGKNGKQAPTNPVTLIVKPRRKDRVFSWKLSWPALVTATKAARAWTTHVRNPDFLTKGGKSKIPEGNVASLPNKIGRTW